MGRFFDDLKQSVLRLRRDLIRFIEDIHFEIQFRRCEVRRGAKIARCIHADRFLALLAGEHHHVGRSPLHDPSAFGIAFVLLFRRKGKSRREKPCKRFFATSRGCFQNIRMRTFSLLDEGSKVIFLAFVSVKIFEKSH